MSLLELFQRPKAAAVIPEPTLGEKVLLALTELQVAEKRLNELEREMCEKGSCADLPNFQLMESAIRRQSFLVDQLKEEYTTLENELGEYRFQEAVRAQKEAQAAKRQQLLADLDQKDKELAALLEYNRIPFELRYTALQSERSQILNELATTQEQ